MDKERVIELRNKFEGTGMVIYGDNMIITQEEPNVFIEWDDAKEIYYTIRVNRHQDYKKQRENPISVMASDYNTIQYINSSLNPKEFETFLDQLINEGVIKQDKKELMLKTFKELELLK